MLRLQVPEPPRTSGRSAMKWPKLAAGLIAACGALTVGEAVGQTGTAMGGMAMPAGNSGDMRGMAMKMTLPPMPAVYPEAEKPGAPMFQGLGGHHNPISTHSDQAQLYFDQGVRLLFAFNQAEAIRSFREA